VDNVKILNLISEHGMRSLTGITALMALTCLLAGCGGGGSNVDGPAPTIAATCDSGNLWAAQPSPNGSRIPDNASSGVTVTWVNQTCSIQSLTAATLEVCLDHDQPTDLLWTITRPSIGNSQTITAPNNWNSTGTSCETGPGKLQRINLLQTAPNVGTAQGAWTIRVSDAISGNEGTLIQWRVNLQGLR
jgi:subtilisin-like proprotein convertase family protein